MPRIESVSYILQRQIIVLLRIKKTVILGRNELIFQDQDVPRSREEQWKTLDIDTNDPRPKKKQHGIRFLSIDRWPEASTLDPTTIRSR